MKRSLATFFTLLFLASDVAAQAIHRPGPPDIIWGGASLDFPDPFGFSRSNYLESTPASAPSRATPVPLSQLRIPSKALKEFERARKALQSGEVRASAEHLQKAVQIYPDFIEAHNALGLHYIQIGEYQKAVAEHEIALSLNPRSARTHQDLSFAFLLLNRYQEAEAEARQAIDLDPETTASRYFLGRALIGQHRATPEAIRMLYQSEDNFPNASLVLAQIHFEQGRTDQVVTELRRYLRAPADPENKQKAECWVARLSQQPVPAGCPAELTRPSFR